MNYKVSVKSMKVTLELANNRIVVRHFQNKLYETLLCFNIVISVISQIEQFSNITRPCMYLGWGVLFAVVCIEKNFKVFCTPNCLHFIAVYLCLVVFSLFVVIFNNEWSWPNSLSVMIVPIGIMLISSNLAESRIDNELIYTLTVLYFASSLFLAIWINVTHFPSFSNWLLAKEYVFPQKNSAAQIWCSAVFLALSFIKPKSLFQKLLLYMGCGYIILIVFMSQCRTAILALGVVTILSILRKSKRKILWVLLLIGVFIALISIPVVRELLNQALLINKYKGTDLNTFSSGRLDLYLDALKQFQGTPIIGVGKFYVDCSYIRILTESGIIGFLLIESVWIHQIHINIKRSHYTVLGDITSLMVTMTIFYIVESFLEGYPPFGPGVSSFMFWFLNGIVGCGLPKKTLLHYENKSLGD